MEDNQVVLPSGTSLFVEVIDPTGAPIPDALVVMVKADATVLEARTDAAGQVLLENVSPGRVVAQVHATGFTDGAAVATLKSEMHGGAFVVLHPLADPVEIDLSSDATVKKGGVVVKIPANSMVDELGQLVSGMASVSIVPLDPTSDGLSQMPGPLEGISSVGAAPEELTSVFMADITIMKDGKRLQLKDGAKATLTFPVPDALDNKPKSGDAIDTWSFNPGLGAWQGEGQGLVQVSPDDPAKLVWVTDVSHFTVWNSDYLTPYIYKHCYYITLLNGSKAVPNQYLEGWGLDYNGNSHPVTTDIQGHACLNFKNGGNAGLYLTRVANPYQSPTAVPPFKNLKVPTSISDCEGHADACEPLTIQLQQPPVCAPGSKKKCAYSGPSGTKGVGICKAAVQVCKADSSGWGSCQGEVLPQPKDDCSTPKDENCSGQVNEGCMNLCVLGTTQTCYSGPAGTSGVGACKAGTQTCVAVTSGTVWGDCTGQVLPTTELCSNTTDDDCDGTQAECQCKPGEKKSCYDGPAGTGGVGSCKLGVQTCEQSFVNGGGSRFGGCVGQVKPVPENCSTPADDNCNGTANEKAACCASAADCGTDTACVQFTCTVGKCGSTLTPAGTMPSGQASGDCQKSVCDGNGGLTTAPDATDVPNDGKECTDDICNGGPQNPAKPLGAACNQSGGTTCDGMGSCKPPSCTDTVKNGTETDKDCGGPTCQACSVSKTCLVNTDCGSKVCTGGICQAATCMDAVKNNTETDVDCGGVGCAGCPAGKVCVIGADCQSNICLANNTCQ
jgi:hypothetical protein